MTADRDALAAEIRKHIAPADDHVPDGYWWYDGGKDGELPEALAADLLAAGWRAPKPIEYGRWYRTVTPDGELWAETSDPHDWYLAHPDPAVALTWQRITTDGDWVEWADHPTDLVHPSTLDEDDDS